MDKALWEKLRKDLNKIPAQERLLYLKGILKNVKDDGIKKEVDLEIKKTQEIINNEIHFGLLIAL